MGDTVKIVPQNERVLVEPIMIKNTTESGLVISGGGEDKIETSFGTIVAVSKDLKDKHKINEVVYYNARAGVGVLLYNKKYRLLIDNEILAKLEVDRNANLDAAIRDNEI